MVIHFSTIFRRMSNFFQGGTMTETAERIEDRLSDFTRDKRILLLSAMAVVVGLASAFVAKALVWLIAVFTNLTFYQRFSSDFVSPTNHHLGPFVIFAPVVGGLIIGLLARYGSEKIVAFPDEILHEAVTRMVRHDIGRL